MGSGTGGTSATNPGGGVGAQTVTSIPGADGASAMPLRHLTSREYRSTVQAILGDTSVAEDDVPNEASDPTFAYFPFRTTGTVGVVEAQGLQYAAELVATNVAANVGAVLPCSPANAGEEAGCANQFITTFGAKAYRRPLDSGEVTRLTSLYDRGRGELALDFQGAVALLIEAILQSPAFYYHWQREAGPATVEANGVVKLGAYVLANRMSYFLWGAPPDAPLLDAAATGQLGTDAAVEGQARRMLQDQRARDMLGDFLDDLLDLDVLLARPKDTQIYPMYNVELQEAMRAEAKSFAALSMDGAGTFTALLTSTQTAVNQPLAALYGVSGVTGSSLSPASLSATERGGLLTLSGFLANTGATAGSDPPRRGKVVYTRFLCEDLPPPPPDVPAVTPAAQNVSTRQRFEQHDENPCARACHNILDGIGFAFEHYDGIGSYRTTDMNVPVNASGSFVFDDTTPVAYANAVELGEALAASTKAQHCFTTQWLRYAFRRFENDGDTASLEAVRSTFASSGGSVRELLVALTRSRTFRFRVLGTGEVQP